MSFLNEFWCGLGANCPPNWAHFGAKLGPKSDQKCIANFILLSISFWFDLGVDFAPTWPSEPPKNGAKLAPKSVQLGVLI